MQAVNIDSMGQPHPTIHADRFPPPMSGYGAQPMVPPVASANSSFYIGALRPYTPPLMAITGANSGLPFNPSTPVPANGMGTQYVSWPVAGG